MTVSLMFQAQSKVLVVFQTLNGKVTDRLILPYESKICVPLAMATGLVATSERAFSVVVPHL